MGIKLYRNMKFAIPLHLNDALTLRGLLTLNLAKFRVSNPTKYALQVLVKQAPLHCLSMVSGNREDASSSSSSMLRPSSPPDSTPMMRDADLAWIRSWIHWHLRIISLLGSPGLPVSFLNLLQHFSIQCHLVSLWYWRIRSWW